MLISIVIPTKNREKDLIECIESIVKQTALPNELIIIDDGNISIAKKNLIQYLLQNSDIIFQYFKKEIADSSESRNLGAKKASGEIILFLDDDVILNKNYIEKIIKVYEENKENEKLAGVGGMINAREKSFIEKIFDRTFFLHSSKPWSILPWGFQTWKYDLKKEEKTDWLPGCNCSFRKEIFRKYQFKSLQVGRVGLEEIEFCWQIIKDGYYFIITPFAKLVHKEPPIAQETAFLSGWKEGFNRFLIFELHVKKTLKNYFCFLIANLGWIIRKWLAIFREPKLASKHFLYSLGLIKGNFDFIRKFLWKKKESQIKKIKILQIITLSEWGGVQRVCFDLIKNLDKKKFQVEVACKPGGILIEKLKEIEIRVYSINSFRRGIFPINDFKTLISLYRLIKKRKYDIVHCHSTKAGVLGRTAARLAGVKKIYFTVHGWGFYNEGEYSWIKRIIEFLEKITAKCSTRIICVSENDKKEGIKRKIAEKDKFLVIKNGIDWKVEGSKEKTRGKLGLKEDEIAFGMIGRLVYQKNPLMFLRTAKEIIKIYQKAKFILIGGGSLFQECQNFIKKNRLENNIFLLGKKLPDEIRELLLGFDVFVLTSKYEGLPLTIIEAMFAGLPIIATNVGGVSELIEDGKNGFLVNLNSIEELVQKMIYFIENPKERKEMGKKSQKVAEENFTLDKMIKKYESLYNNI